MDEFIRLIRESSGCGPWPEPELPPLPPHLEKLAAETSAAVPYRAVLFDVYGTLFSSAAGDIAHAAHNGNGCAAQGSAVLDAVAALYDPALRGSDLRSWFLQKVKEIHTELHQRTEWPEVRVEQIWDDFLQQRSLPGSAQELALRYELAVNPVYPMPGAERAITALRESGCVMGIISNAQFYTPLLFKTFCGGLPEEIGFDRELLIYSYECREAKPAPRLYETAASRLRSRGIAPAECAFIGNDMLSDIYGAHNAGFQTILFAGDRRSLRLRENDDRVKNLSPQRIIRRLSELIMPSPGSP